MNRREAMKKVSVLRVVSLSVSTIVVFQQGCLTNTRIGCLWHCRMGVE